MQKPPKPIEKKSGKRAELAAWIEQNQPARINDAEFRQLIGVLAPISESYLRKLLRDMPLELAPLVEGVRQGTFDQLETSLTALLDEYESGDSEHRSAARRLVITAKDHARWAARRTEKEAEKNEMVLWMLTWLENPPVFREWVKLRRAYFENDQPAP